MVSEGDFLANVFWEGDVVRENFAFGYVVFVCGEDGLGEEVVCGVWVGRGGSCREDVFYFGGEGSPVCFVVVCV